MSPAITLGRPTPNTAKHVPPGDDDGDATPPTAHLLSGPGNSGPVPHLSANCGVRTSARRAQDESNATMNRRIVHLCVYTISQITVKPHRGLPRAMSSSANIGSRGESLAGPAAPLGLTASDIPLPRSPRRRSDEHRTAHRWMCVGEATVSRNQKHGGANGGARNSKGSNGSWRPSRSGRSGADPGAGPACPSPRRRPRSGTPNRAMRRRV